MERWTYKIVNCWKDGQTDIPTELLIDERTDKQKADRIMDSWRDRQNYGHMKGQTDRIMNLERTDR